MRTIDPAIATNHQHGAETADRPNFTRTHQRRDHLQRMIDRGVDPEVLGDAFLCDPLYQRNYAQGFGTLFTAVYDLGARELCLRWPKQDWVQQLDSFEEGQRIVSYSAQSSDDADWIWRQFDPETFLAASGYIPPETFSIMKNRSVGQATDGRDWLSYGRAFAAYYSQSVFRP
jgi:hypothetical protein